MKYKIIFILFVLFFICNCATNKKTITETDYLKNIEEKTKNELPAELSLNDCIDLALKNNLAIRKSEMQKQIAESDKNIAFSAFLPKINFTLGFKEWHYQPEQLAGPNTYRIIQDKSITDRAIEIQLPIIAPAAWFVYSSYKRGTELSDIIKQYTAQMIKFQTILYYYKCLIAEENKNFLVSQINAAKALYSDFETRKNENLLLDWQLEELKVFLMSKYSELNHYDRLRKIEGAKLLDILGYSPLADIKLKHQQELEMPKETLTDLMLEALKNNLSIKIANKNLDISNEKIKIAISNFLPTLISFANFTHTNNEYTKYANQTILGLSGVISIFNGFKDIAEYQKARKSNEIYYLQMEEAMLSVLLQVLETYNNLQDADETLKIIEKNLAVETARLNNIKEKHKENLVSSSELLQVLANYDTVKSAFIKAQYNRQILIAALYNIINRNLKTN